jgi:hypothetical protein
MYSSLEWDTDARNSNWLQPAASSYISLQVGFGEGQDPSGGPDEFGAAILDNIDVNGTLVGHGATGAS